MRESKHSSLNELSLSDLIRSAAGNIQPPKEALGGAAGEWGPCFNYCPFICLHVKAGFLPGLAAQ